MVPICTPSMSEFGFACAPAPPKPVNAAMGEGAPKMDSLRPRIVAAGTPKASFPNSRLVNIIVSS